MFAHFFLFAHFSRLIFVDYVDISAGKRFPAVSIFSLTNGFANRACIKEDTWLAHSSVRCLLLRWSLR